MQADFRINRRQPVVTYALAALNAAFFLADMLITRMTGIAYLKVYGAKINEMILYYGEWWRFVTPMFLHGGIEHILFNTMALVIWGRQLEALLGRGRYLALYFGSGILGCVASFAFSTAVSVGASGAIFGLFGALLYFRKRYPNLFNAVFGVQVLIIIGINLLNGFLPGSQIDNFGHLGGLFGGFLLCGVTGFYGGSASGARPLYLAGYLAAHLAMTALRFWSSGLI